MQSMAVLLLEMTYNVQGTTEEKFPVVLSIKNLIRWLRALQTNDPVAARAYTIVRQTLGSSAPLFQPHVDNLLALDSDGV
jgi:hypothetical protein